MKTMMVALALASICVSPSCAEEAKPLTVEQVLGVGVALRGLSTRPDGTPVPTGTYRFMGRAMVQLAIIQQQTDVVQRAYDDVIKTAAREAFNDEPPQTVKDDPKRSREYADKERRFQEIVAKALAAPSGVTLGRLREIDLCLDAKPPACPIANPISLSTVTLLLPVLDRDGQ